MAQDVDEGRESRMITTTEKELSLKHLNLKGKDLLTLADLTPDEILTLLENAKKIKDALNAGFSISH